MNKTLQICVFNEFYKTDIRRHSSVNISVLETPPPPNHIFTSSKAGK